MDSHLSLRSLAWMLTIVTASLGFSFGFACATPFAALAAIGGTQLRRSEALVAVLLAWLGNQSIGYLVLHYPRTWESFAWGGAIGIAATLAAVGVLALEDWTTRPVARTIVAFTVAFVAYECTLYAAAWVLPSEGNAFASRIVARILEINAVAYVGLLVIHRFGVNTGLLEPAALSARTTYPAAS